MLLGDADRSECYRSAIRAALDEFRLHNGRAPVVLDLGTGTGLLGLHCVRAGAERVYSVDINERCLAGARKVAQLQGAGNWEVVHADDLDDAVRFDVIVSELLGTAAFGEDCFRDVGEYVPRLREDVVGGPYIVPRRVVQTVRLAQMPGGWLGDAIAEAVGAKEAFVGTNSLNLHPACLKWSWVGERAAVYEADFEALDERRPAASVACPVEGRHVLLSEWSATLWGDVRLHNTIDGYGALQVANAIDRECAWGFAIAMPPPGARVTTSVVDGPTGEPRLRAVAQETAAGTAECTAANGHAANAPWCVEGVVSADASVAALIAGDFEAATKEALRNVRGDVLVETRENACVVPLLEAACKRHKLDEPWHQDDVGAAWTMRNPVLRTGVSVQEPPEGGSLELALLPDVFGECVTEAACRYNDDRFAPEQPTHALVDQLIDAMGGHDAMRTFPERRDIPKALEWYDAVLPMPQDAPLRAALCGPADAMAHYASLTRHGMLGAEEMPGSFVQGMPLAVRSAGVGVRLRMAAPPQVRGASAQFADDRTLSDALARDAVGLRRMVSALCTAGAAVVFDP